MGGFTYYFYFLTGGSVMLGDVLDGVEWGDSCVLLEYIHHPVTY